MGKGKKNRNKIKKKQSIDTLPNVSICTPTFNRRPFFKGLIQCIKDQDYPHSKIEWVVVDDGFDKVEDLISDSKEILNDIKITYCREETHMPLGKKRNFMHQKCTFTGDDDVIVYMDDDDYYPPTRVSHAVKKLQSHKNALCAGSSELYIWFNTLDKMYKFGPYGPNHATAGTFAFRRKLLKQSHYEDEAVLAEEKHFLKNYTIPFVQLDPFHTILVFSHEQNTFDKRRLITKQNSKCKESYVKCKQIVKSPEQLSFYTEEILNSLKLYSDGDVKHKPNVLNEIKRRDAEREKIMQSQMQNVKTPICITDKDGNKKELTTGEVMTILRESTERNKELTNIKSALENENKNLKETNDILKAKLVNYEEKIKELESTVDIDNNRIIQLENMLNEN